MSLLIQHLRDAEAGSRGIGFSRIKAIHPFLGRETNKLGREQSCATS